MTGDDGGADLYTPAQYREHLESYGLRDPDGHPLSGIVQDGDVGRYLSVVNNHYDADAVPSEMPGNPFGEGNDRGLEEIENIASIAAADRGREAMAEGDMQTLKHLTGQQDQRADISGMKAIQRIDQVIESPAPVIVILGEMGAGKTDFANLLGQRARHLLGIEKVASNVKSLRETDQWHDQDGEPHPGYVPGYDTLDEWVKQDGDPVENEQSSKVFIGDEFSSEGSGSGKSGYMMRKLMGPIVYKIRKYNGLLIYIAHDASSIHPLLWRLGVIIHKEDQKTATAYDRVSNGKLRDQLWTVEGVPPTDWRYNTQEATSWDWPGDADSDDGVVPEDVAYDTAVYIVAQAKENDLSIRKTADMVPFGKTWVGDRRAELEAGEHEGIADKVLSWTD